MARYSPLLDQKWSIVVAPDRLPWFTSDNPVVKLNYYSAGTYDFGGGWGNPGTEIFLPLDPRYLLYTHVGSRPMLRGTVLSQDMARRIRGFIAEHAHRMIFAASIEDEVSTLRPRLVNPDVIQAEKEMWRRWHDDQSRAELELTPRLKHLTDP